MSLIDHILTNSKEKVRNYGVTSSGISDDEFIYCTWKTKTVKTGNHTTISITYYRKYSKELLQERLRKKDLPDYSAFNCIGAAYTDLTTALQGMFNEITLMKDLRVKGVRDKLKERFLKTKVLVDHECFKEQCNSVQQKIKNRK